MSAEKKILKIKRSCELALSNLENGNKRLAQGDVNYIRAFAEAAYWILDDEINEEEEY